MKKVGTGTGGGGTRSSWQVEARWSTWAFAKDAGSEAEVWARTWSKEGGVREEMSRE
jgi:hypothetical protein